MASVTSTGVDGQLPPALNVRKITSGRYHLARLALSRVEVKTSEPSVKAAKETVKENERIQHPREAVKTPKTQADIRHVFSDPAHGSRVGISTASLTNPFQAPILWQEVDHAAEVKIAFIVARKEIM